MKKLIICLVFTIFLIGGVSCFWEKDEEEEGTVRVRNLSFVSSLTEVYIYTLGSARGTNLVASSSIPPGSSRDFKKKVGYYVVEVCKNASTCTWVSGDIGEDYTWSPGFNL